MDNETILQILLVLMLIVWARLAYEVVKHMDNLPTGRKHDEVNHG